MKYRDYYAVLGVARDASPEAIKKAYRNLAREYHPDINNSPGAEARFKEINEANEVLSDPEKRKRYDALGANWKSGQDFTPPPGWGDFRRTQSGPGGIRFEFGGSGGDFSDFFSAIFGDWEGATRQSAHSRRGGSPFADFGGFDPTGGIGGQGFTPRGRDYETHLTVSLEELFSRAQRRLCSRCRIRAARVLRRGRFRYDSGGATEGTRIRLSGQGEDGGSLYLNFARGAASGFQAQRPRFGPIAAHRPVGSCTGRESSCAHADGCLDHSAGHARRRTSAAGRQRLRPTSAAHGEIFCHPAHRDSQISDAAGKGLV